MGLLLEYKGVEHPELQPCDMAAVGGVIQVPGSFTGRQSLPERRDATQTLPFANHCHGSLC